MFEIRISKRAEKKIKKLKKVYQAAILSALDEIKEDPNLSKPLSQELTGKFSFHLSFYRIIYKVNQKDKIVTVLDIGPRSTIYNS